MNPFYSDPRASIAYDIRGTFRAFENTLISALARQDLSVGFFHIMCIDWPKQGMTQKEIADLAFLTPSVASQQIQKMCKAGLLCREQDKHDVRKKIVKLTKEGRDKRKRVVTPILEIPKTAAESMSDEDIQITLTVLKQLRENLK